MKVQEIMERAGISETGRAIAYIKDALEEMNMHSETHVKLLRQNLTKDKRFYDLPFDLIKIVNIRCKNQDNSSNEYRSIPRSAYTPSLGDDDGI